VQDTTRCRYFNWADEPLKPPGAAFGGGGGGGGGGSGDNVCFKCNQPGERERKMRREEKA
jgi:hypothetical protein